MKARSVLSIAGGILAVMYPGIVYLGLTHFGPRAVALLLIAVMIPVALIRLSRTPNGSSGETGSESPTAQATRSLRHLAFVPLISVGLLTIEAVRNEATLVFLVPVIINGMLLFAFAVTLWSPHPMIERFARLIDPDLTEPEIAWCRLWTQLWCAFFAVNMTIIAALGVWGPVTWWAAYTGGLAYVGMGLMFAIEYIVRKIRFRRFGNNPLDRALARWTKEPHA